MSHEKQKQNGRIKHVLKAQGINLKFYKVVQSVKEMISRKLSAEVSQSTVKGDVIQIMFDSVFHSA